MNRLPVLRWTDGSVEVELMEAGMRSAGVSGRERPEHREEGGQSTGRKVDGAPRGRQRESAGEEGGWRAA